MGLDVSYYERIEPAPDADREEDDDVIHWYTLEGFEARLDDFTDAEMVRVSGKAGHFRAGSYVGYNAWRKTLARVIHGVHPRHFWEGNDARAPFAELINFADNEGCIGPKTSAKLAKDFEDYGEKFASDPAVEEWHREKYMEWCRAFQCAANTGCVEFH